MPPTIKESFKHTQILVKSKGDPEPFGKENERGERGKKLEFFGDANGNSHTFVCFRPALFDGIVVGQTIDTDYDITETVSGDNTYVNYKVNQIYDKDGKELAQAGGPGGPGGRRGGYGKSPEEREEIARAVALKVAVGNTPEGTTPAKVITEATKYLDFLRAPKTADPKVSGPAQVAPEPPDPSTSPVVTRDALKGLAALAKELGVSTDWLKAAALRLYGKGDIKTIVEIELSDLTDKLGIEAERLKEESPF